MHYKLKALKAAFPYTIPVMTGFLFLGMAYGIMVSSKGYGPGWTLLMSTFIFAGSMQFVGINLLTTAFNPVNVFFLTLMVNARHLFYGISMLERYRDTGRKKYYMIFGLIDETFSIICSSEPPPDVDKNWFMFFVTLLNHIYWVTASLLGSVVGSLFSFNTKGIDFVMTALFVVIFVNQWQSQKQHAPALIGIASSILCLLIFGSGGFIIPSMVLIILTLTALRKPIEGGTHQ